MALSLTVSEINGDFAKFSHSVVFTPSLKGFPLEFCNGGEVKKLE